MEEPYAGNPPVRICAGGGLKSPSPTATIVSFLPTMRTALTSCVDVDVPGLIGPHPRNRKRRAEEKPRIE